MSNYESKAKTTTIHATSRASVKVKDSYYTVEYSEERMLPDDPSLYDLAREKESLWLAVNEEVDGQIEDIVKSFT